ncbi:hypothetical protein [Pantoea agglomerans]|nr:hypothetical protein [Pantoea agglomerans]MDK4219219.1 hypothetical protein [Pantoea agglomerans]
MGQDERQKRQAAACLIHAAVTDKSIFPAATASRVSLSGVFLPERKEL